MGSREKVIPAGKQLPWISKLFMICPHNLSALFYIVLFYYSTFVLYLLFFFFSLLLIFLILTYCNTNNYYNININTYNIFYFIVYGYYRGFSVNFFISIFWYCYSIVFFIFYCHFLLLTFIVLQSHHFIILYLLFSLTINI